MYLAHAGGRVVPTASFVGTDSYAVLVEYLLATVAIVFVSMRSRARPRFT